ncbi:MAG: GNAT family N-acetyltransferase [Bacillota bacterium]
MTHSIRSYHRVAIEKTGAVAGWIGGISMYGGNVWEIHLLVVGARHRNKLVGRARVEDLRWYQPVSRGFPALKHNSLPAGAHDRRPSRRRIWKRSYETGMLERIPAHIRRTRTI